MTYSLASRCISECFATMTFVFLLLTLLANKLLPKTKGHDLGFGWVAFGAGLAVFAPVQFLGHISTSLNPAMALGSAVAGSLPWREFPAIALSETVGAFFGALMMYLFYYPQFRTVPEPPPKRDAERLLRTVDDIGHRALNYVSYNARENEPPLRTPAARRPPLFRQTPNGSTVYRSSDVLGPHANLAPLSRCRSIMVADLQHRLKEMEVPNIDTSHLSETVKSVSIDFEDPDLHVQCTSQKQLPNLGPTMVQPGRRPSNAIPATDLAQELVEIVSGGSGLTQPNAGQIEKKEVNESEQLLEASRAADRKLKLAVFCTRPATYCPPINFFTEMVSAFFLVIGILFIRERAGFLYDGYDDVYRHGVASFYVGMLISVLVLSLGGMGVAMNPARDLAPRFVHWLLPIPGKGHSEWYYSWIPVLGPLAGGAIAGRVFLLLEELNKSAKEGRMYDDAFNQVLEKFDLTD